jgi:hypothetical protein
MKVLYHGTRYLQSILKDQCLRIAPIGETLSLTTRKYVAKHFAELLRDNVFDFGYIITLDWMLLHKDGYDLRPVECSWDTDNEYEWDCIRSIDFIWRYILKIERVPNSYIGPEEVARRRPGYMEAYIDKHGPIQEVDLLHERHHPSKADLTILQ